MTAITIDVMGNLPPSRRPSQDSRWATSNGMDADLSDRKTPKTAIIVYHHLAIHAALLTSSFVMSWLDFG
jgi:hypothetical protein